MPIETTNIPHIGEQWPEQGGVYAGLARGFDGEPDAHLVLLPDEPAGKLSWPAAVKWAKGLGNEARLPTRFESALLYTNLQDQFRTDDWYWTGTQSPDNYAFIHYFGYGTQDYNTKKYEGRCRAVRRFVL
jgi:hypothetical protein